jgi:hypothetical protein
LIGIILLVTKAKVYRSSTNRTLQLYEMAAKLAKKIFNLKCKGSTLVMRLRKDRQDIEIMTGYVSSLPSSDRRIQMYEYEGRGEVEDIETEPKPRPSSEG